MRNSVYRHCGNACACCVYVHHSVSFFCCRFVVQTILTVTVDRRWDTLVRQGKVTSCTSDESQYLSLSSSQLCRMRLHLQLQRLFQTTKHCPALAGASIPLPWTLNWSKFFYTSPSLFSHTHLLFAFFRLPLTLFSGPFP